MTPPLTHVRLVKVADKGVYENHPIFEGYTVLGFTQDLPVIDDSLYVLRYNRNGIEIPGRMMTTPVTSVYPVTNDGKTHYLFETANSCYRLDILADLPAAP